MNLLRKTLFPLAIIYWLVTFIRNWLYDIGLFRSISFDVPIIAVGNLSVGGTGKTPHVEYLIRLLMDSHKIAVLSRGYKRITNGFIIANEDATADTIGDEPFQFYTKFKKKCIVAVDVNRRNGIKNLLSLPNKPDVILLDDAFQHRRVKAGYYILLTSYNDLFVDDYILPFGNLREPSFGKKRADLIIVTKCPNDLKEIEQQQILKKLQVSCPVFFSTVVYDDFVYDKFSKINVNSIKKENKLLVAGIVNPTPFFDYLKKENDEFLVFSDHHHFTQSELKIICQQSKGNKIITTEKDFVRLNTNLLNSNWYYLPIRININNSIVFENLITKFIQNILVKK